MKKPQGYSYETYYYLAEGRDNLDKTIELVIQRLNELPKIKKVLTFTSNGEGALKIKEMLGDRKIEVIAVTFPYKMPFYTDGPDGNKKQIFAGTSDTIIRKELKKKRIKLIQGVMALQDISVPGASLIPDSKISTINATLAMISGGLKLCIESIIMATDSGNIEQGEEVISFSADTAIVATGCRKQWLFHPENGLEIRELICKPRFFSITHKKQKK